MVHRQVVVLAGGFGTRMLPRTEKVPKVLLDVAGRPFADWLLRKLEHCGFDEVIFCVGHLGERVREHVGEGDRFGVRARWVDEGKDLRGTGGALALAASQGILADEFLVTYGDSWLPFDYAAPLAKLRARPELDGVMAVFRNEGRWDASNVALSADGDLVSRYEKGSKDPALDHIDYGATALRRSCLASFGERFGLEALQRALSVDRKLGAVVADERFYEIGSPQGLSDLEERLAREGSP